MKNISTRHRIRRTREQIQTLIGEYRTAGLSAREFAQARQIALSTLTNWLRRHRPSAEPRWIEVSPPPGSMPPTEVVSIRFTDGLSIDLRPGFEAAPVAQLISLLRQI